MYYRIIHMYIFIYEFVCIYIHHDPTAKNDKHKKDDDDDEEEEEEKVNDDVLAM